MTDTVTILYESSTVLEKIGGGIRTGELVLWLEGQQCADWDFQHFGKIHQGIQGYGGWHVRGLDIAHVRAADAGEFSELQLRKSF